VAVPVLTSEELDNKLAEIVTRLRETFAPEAIYLFGSYADGAPRPDSDIDLLVILSKSDLDAYDRDGQAYLALSGLNIPKDVQVYTRAEFEQQARLPGSLARSIKSRGRIIYER
jgi:uncharacterized protein